LEKSEVKRQRKDDNLDLEQQRCKIMKNDHECKFIAHKNITKPLQITT